MEKRYWAVRRKKDSRIDRTFGKIIGPPITSSEWEVLYPIWTEDIKRWDKEVKSV